MQTTIETKLFSKLSKINGNIVAVEDALDTINILCANKVKELEFKPADQLNKDDIKILSELTKMLIDIRKLRANELDEQLMDINLMTQQQKNTLFGLYIKQTEQLRQENEELKNQLASSLTTKTLLAPEV